MSFLAGAVAEKTAAPFCLTHPEHENSKPLMIGLAKAASDID
jgi:hypothetical protein